MTKAGCPYCFHPSFDGLKNFPPNQSRRQPQVRIDQVRDRIHQLDATVAELSRQRAALLQELNTVQPPTSIIPAEILSLIFQFACPLPNVGFIAFSGRRTAGQDMQKAIKNSSHWYHTYIILGQVSTYWRQILLSTPQLWTSIHLNIDDKTARSEAMFLGRFLNRSARLSLTLSLAYYYKGAVPTSTWVHGTVDTQLLENLLRTETLYLKDPPSTWFSHFPFLTELTYIYLDHIAAREGVLELSLTHSPNLHKLAVIDVTIPIILPSPCLVTSLNIRGVPFDNLFHLLTQCPNLAELFIGNSLSPMVDFTPLPTERIIFEGLKELHLELGRWGGLLHDAFLDNIRLPSLKTLYLSGFIRTEALLSVGDFLANLPLGLSLLDISEVEMSDPNLEIFALAISRLRDNTHIEYLGFRECGPSFIYDVLGTLVPHSDRELRFSHLRHIALDCVFFETGDELQNDDREISLLLQRIIESRVNGSSELFTVELQNLSDISDLHLDQQALAEFRGRENYIKDVSDFPLIQQVLAGLRGRGYNIEIVLDS
ncbi:hypothetical protein P691DRAFT_849225 [Macrolepiota fuliginosa MF-IS2]|uniref:F-box domain-containing protein n=1 Tax=Macrolepiota fuliginosa MF-IS2 TaxID=1400762 RepID=A0A9P5XFG8_9AGAR|nr:hypothetical protein P691DRAFT_849225 [Macrolepiota fuliginosa MF-IS2]